MKSGYRGYTDGNRAIRNAGTCSIVRGGQMLVKPGAKEATRHLLVEFLPDGRALLAPLERLNAAAAPTCPRQIKPPATAKRGSSRCPPHQE